MDLVGQGCSDTGRLKRSGSGLDADGFTMVVLLVVMAVMAVGTTALLPTWRQQAIREQEEELIFRGNQYARAVLLYSRKNNNLLPADAEVLYTGKFLRKKYKDPITGGDFALLPAGQPPGAAGRGSLGQNAGRGGTPARGGLGGGATSGRGLQVVGSIQGVYSTSTDTSIRVYQNQQRYIDWPFTFQTAQLMMGQARGNAAGGRQGGDGGPAGRGGVPGGNPGGPGGARGGPPGRGGGQPLPPAGPGRGGAVPPGAAGGRGRGNF